MFTGLVETTGTLAKRSTGGAGARITVQARFEGEPVALGESIAVDGVCLSVDAVLAEGVEFDASSETCSRTTLGTLELGSRVHLERALRLGDRLGGHLVSGHVDGIGVLVERRQVGDAVWMAFDAPARLRRFIAEKGSVTLDGVSLTVNAVSKDRFEVTVIPHTLAKTKLGDLVPGSRVNVEVDLIARYVLNGLVPPPR